MAACHLHWWVLLGRVLLLPSNLLVQAFFAILLLLLFPAAMFTPYPCPC